MPRTVLRYAGGRELTLGDLGTRDGLLGGINAVIVGNYLTTLGRDPDEDLDAARRAADADQGTLEDAVSRPEYCDHCGEPLDAATTGLPASGWSSSRRATARRAGAG